MSYKQVLRYVPDFKLDAFVELCDRTKWNVGALAAMRNQSGGYDFVVLIRKKRVVTDANPEAPMPPDVRWDRETGAYVLT